MRKLTNYGVDSNGVPHHPISVIDCVKKSAESTESVIECKGTNLRGNAGLRT